ISRDFRAFDALTGWSQVQVVHCHKDATLRWLQSVADIWQRTADDDAHRIGEIAGPHLIFDVQSFDAVRTLWGLGIVWMLLLRPVSVGQFRLLVRASGRCLPPINSLDRWPTACQLRRASLLE